MNRRGFTLVELLSVVIILAGIMTLTIVVVNRTREDAVNKITETERENIIEAAKIYAIDMDSQGKSYSSVTIATLVSGEYLNVKTSRCSGTIRITNGSNDYEVDISGVTCK